jgi:hypothetical protein
MQPVKLASSLLILCSALILCACDTPNTRRAMYSPKKGSGYWTTRAEKGKYWADAEQKRTPPRDYTPKEEEAKK